MAEAAIAAGAGTGKAAVEIAMSSTSGNGGANLDRFFRSLVLLLIHLASKGRGFNKDKAFEAFGPLIRSAL